MDTYEGESPSVVPVLPQFSLHKYRYADNNPINKTDPSGLSVLVAETAHLSYASALKSSATRTNLLTGSGLKRKIAEEANKLLGLYLTAGQYQIEEYSRYLPSIWREHIFLRWALAVVPIGQETRKVDNHTFARADIIPYYDVRLRVSGWGTEGLINDNFLRADNPPNGNISAERHAEANALYSLWVVTNGDLRGERVAIFTDRALCPYCADSSGIETFGRILGLRQLMVISPPFK